MIRKVVAVILFLSVIVIGYFSFVRNEELEKDIIYSDLRLSDITIPYNTYDTIEEEIMRNSEVIQNDVIYDLGDIVQATSISDFTIRNNNLYLLLGGANNPIFRVVFEEHDIIRGDSFGDFGRGPGEFSLPTYFGVDFESNNNLLVFDQRNRRISFLSADEDSISVQDQFMTDLDFGTFVLFDNQIFANGDFFDDTAIAVLEKKGEAFIQVDAFRNAVFTSKNTDFTPAVLVHLNRSAMIPHPDGEFIAKAYLYTPVIQIFNYNGELINEINIDEDFDLNYRITFDNRENIDRFLRTEETKFAYLSVAASSESIYVLFSGRSEATHAGDEFSFEYFAGNEVHVFDWSGNLINKVELDTDVNRIYFDNSSGQLYGIRMYDDFSLVNFGQFMRL